MDQLYVGRDFAEREGSTWIEAEIDRLAVLHAALGRLIQNIGGEVVHSSGWGLLYNRPSDGAEVSIEPLFELLASQHQNYRAYRFADRWRVEAPLTGNKVARAELAADPTGSPRVVASSLFMQLSGARYAGQPVPYRNNR